MPQRNKNLTKYLYYLTRKPIGLLLLILFIAITGGALKAQISSFNGDEDSVSGISSLMNAVVNNDIEGVRFFVKAGSDIINQKNLGGATPLHLAARNGFAEIASILIDNGADINATDNEKWTPLMRAATAKNPGIISLLLDKGADAKKYNLNGETAIMHSADSECVECLYNLLNKYDFTQMDNQDLRDQINQAYTIARNKNNTEMQTMLSDYLAHLNDKAANKVIEEEAAVAAVTSSTPENLVEENNNTTPSEAPADAALAKETNKDNAKGDVPIVAPGIKQTDNKQKEKNLRYRFSGEVSSKDQQSEWKNPDDGNKNAQKAVIVGEIPSEAISKPNKKYIFKKMDDNSNKPKIAVPAEVKAEENVASESKSTPTTQPSSDQTVTAEQSHPVTKYKFNKLEDQAPAVTKELIAEIKRLKKANKHNNKLKTPIPATIAPAPAVSATPAANNDSTINDIPKTNNITVQPATPAEPKTAQPAPANTPIQAKTSTEASPAPSTAPKKYMLVKPKSKEGDSKVKSPAKPSAKLSKAESPTPIAAPAPAATPKTVPDNTASPAPTSPNQTATPTSESTGQKKIFKLRTKVATPGSAPELPVPTPNSN